MSFDILEYRQDLEAEWDAFCSGTLQGTLLHTRRFLSYHGERFQDRSLLAVEDGRIVGVLPAALNPGDATCVVSHPGATYGGLLHSGHLRGERMVEALSAVLKHYAARGIQKLVYKAVPCTYHKAPAQDDLYALFRFSARRLRCDLSSTIALRARLPVSERRRRSLKKARKANAQVIRGSTHLPAFWQMLALNLERKHGTRPVHTLAELDLLAGRFPTEMELVVATLDGQVEAGTLLFRTATCDHAQYIAASERGNETCALDAVFEDCIGAAGDAGKDWFDFGISTEDAGMTLNEGLYRFKSEFGAGGTLYEFYELNCRSA